jgi:ribokinase
VTRADERDRGAGGGVLVLGSANVDTILRVPTLPGPGETVLGQEALLRPGGKGANQAVAAALSGVPVSIAGRVGEDAHAESVRAALVDVGVDVRLLRTASGHSTGLAVVLVTPDGENAIAVSPGANHALTPGDVDSLRPHFRRADVVLLQLELRRDVVSAAVDLATDVGTPVVLNLAPPTELSRSVLERVQVLVVNQSEAEFLLGQELSDHDACRRYVPALRELGPAAVVLTAGGEGAFLCDAEGVLHVPAIDVPVVDTAGAGDAFVGVLAGELSRGRSLRAAVATATRAAAVAVQSAGAQLSAPLSELDPRPLGAS